MYPSIQIFSRYLLSSYFSSSIFLSSRDTVIIMGITFFGLGGGIYYKWGTNKINKKSPHSDEDKRENKTGCGGQIYFILGDQVGVT